jgi:hypothetical protein
MSTRQSNLTMGTGSRNVGPRQLGDILPDGRDRRRVEAFLELAVANGVTQSPRQDISQPFLSGIQGGPGLAMIHNFPDRSKHRSLLIPTPRMGTLSDWSFRRGAPLRSPIKIFFGGAPRLSNQSERVSILGVRISSQLQTVFFPIFHFSSPPSYY